MYLQLQGIEKTGFSTSDKSPIHHACTWFQRFIFTIFIAIWLIFESASAQAQTPEIRVDGSVNGNFFIPIANGDTTPSLFDGTDIGRQSVGVPSTGRIFSINNTGSAPLTVSNISVSGANGGSFPYFIETSLTDIPPGEHGIVRIGFEPNFIGSHEATITFNSNDADDSAYTFSIRGDSIAANTPDILVSGKDVEIINGDGTPSTTDATDLGTIHIGGTQSSRFLIRNIGTSSLSLSSVVLGGPNANQFTITQQPPSIIGSTANYIQLPGSPGSDLVIEYQPTVAGTHIATVEITSNDPDETPFTYFIQGVATASPPQPEIAVLGNLFTASPQEISAGDMTASTFDGTVFGDVIIGAPQELVFRIANLGDAPLNVASVSISGPDAADFSLSSAPNSVVQPGSLALFNIQLDPSSVGTKQGVITISSDDVDEGSYSFAISGNAVGSAPDIMVMGQGASIELIDGDSQAAGALYTPSPSLGTDFGTAEINGVSSTRTFIITNLGSQPLNLGANAVRVIDRTFGSGGSEAFSVITQPASVVSAGGNTSFTIEFAPTAVNQGSGVVEISNDDPEENPFMFLISGQAIADPSITVLGDNVEITNGDTTADATDGTDFGPVDINAGLVTQTFQIRNDGGDLLEFPANAVSITGSSDFTVNSQPPAQLVIGGSAQVTVAFDPSATGVQNATIAIISNDPNDSPFIFGLSGEGIDPEIRLTGAGSQEITSSDLTADVADGTDFGFVETGTPATQVFTVENTGSTSLSLGTISITGAEGGDFTVSSPPVASIAPGNTTAFTLEFTPSAAGTRNATIFIPNNDNDESPYIFAVAGQGATPPTVQISNAPAQVNAAFPVDIVFSEDVTGFDISDIIVGNGTASNFSGSGANYSATITPTNPGQVTIDVPAGIAQAVSSLTNLAAPQITVEFDPDAPSLAINGVPGLTNAAFTASFDFNEDVTGFDISDITLTNAVASSFASSSASSYTALITPQSDGDVLIDVAAAVAQDLGGNDNIAAPQAIAVFDSISPDVVISGVPATGNSPFTATFTFSENVTGFTVGDISLSNATASNFNGSGASYTALITPNGDGDITIDVAAAVAQDLASNDNTAAEQAVSEFDDAPPTVSINGVPELTNSAFTVTFEFSEAVTDFTLDDITVSNGSASNLEAAPDGPEGNSIFTATITPEDDGELVLAVDPDRFEDMAGNRNVEGVSMTLLIDLSPPTVIIGGVGESVNGPFQATFTFNEDVFNFEIGDITLSNATASEFSATSSSVYTATITPQTPGQVTIDVFADVANDLAGNGNLEAEQVTTEFTDNNLVRDRTLRIINNFIARRADQLTLDSPDLSRRILNIDAYGQLSGNAVIDNVQLAFQGAASGQDFNLDRLIGEDKASKLNLWTQISISAVNAETAEDDLIFVYLGADYRVSDNTILGAIAQYDYANEEDEIENFDISGHGWLFGPYIVSRLHENLVFDGRVSWGQSYNKISPFNSYEDNFKTDRWLLKGQFTGDFRLDGWRINPDFEMIYFEEKQKAYTDSLGNFIPSQIINLGRATFGPRVSKTYVVDNRYILSPSLNFEGIWDFDQAHIVSLETGLANTTDALRARLESGLALGFKNGSSLNLEGFYDGIGVSRYEAHGLRINFSLPF